MSEKNTKKNKFSTLQGNHRVVPIILISAAALITALLIWGGGAMGGGIKALFKGLFSYGAFAIPFTLLIHGLCYPEDLEHKSVLRRSIFSVVTVVLASCVDYAIFTFGSEPTFFPVEAFFDMTNGGLIGNTIGYAFSLVFGQAGAIIVCVAILAIYATFFYAEKAGSLGQAALRIKGGAKKTVNGIKEKRQEAVEKKKRIAAEEKRQRYEAASEELMSDDFFTSSGNTSGVKVRRLGIDEEASPSGASSLIHPSKRHYEAEPQVAPVEEASERKRRSADKHLDMNYGIDDNSKPTDTKSNQFDRSFFGIDDSADNVFTRDFDPFDFATGERAAAKFASKVSTITSGVQEELDEFAIYEMKANHIPSEREKRLMELERRKQEWLREKKQREAKANGESATKTEDPVNVDSVSLFDSVVDPATKRTPASATSAAAFGAAFDRPQDIPQPVTTPMDIPTSLSEEPAKTESTPTPEAVSATNEQAVPTEVNAYTSYATTKTTYHQPIKTVEFTVTKEPKADPIPQPIPTPIPTPTVPMAEATEDVAILIAEKIARQTPGYQRSANDLKTYTKVVSSPEDEELFRQMNGNSEHSENVFSPSVANEEAVFEATTVHAESEPTITEEFSFEEQTGSSVEFKPYEAPVTPVLTNEEVSEEENTLKVERNMLPPTPEAIAPSQPETVEFEPVFDVVEDEENSDYESDSELNDNDFADENSSDEEDEDKEVVVTEMPEEEEYLDEEIPTELQNPEVQKMRDMFPCLDPDDEQEEISEEVEPEEEDNDLPFDEPTNVKSEPKPEQMAIVPAEEVKPKKKDYSDYVFPDINLLAREESLYDENISIETQENADKLIETLADFGVTASIKGVDRGPRITRYEVVPAKGVKVSQILNLQDDIALNLAAGDIRMEAPIPGKCAVGVEIPNKKSSIVRLRELLETAEFKYSKSKTLSCVGRDIAGQPVFGDLASMPHLLIAGATGMGKSVCINSLLISILYKARPDEVKFIMIDPKQVEFTMYNGIPHLLVPVVTDPKQAAGALSWAVDEMERRFDRLRPLCVRNIDAYNDKVTADPSLGEPMSKIIIVIDEFADLMLQVKDPVESLVMRIAQKARAAGIHLVIGTQRPSVNVITGVIKANVPSRISCKVMSNVDSKTILDIGGAEKLLDKGDSLYAPSGSPKPHRVQCAFVSDREVESIMNFLKQYGDGENYDSNVMADIDRAAQKCSKKGDRDRDDDDGNDGSGEGYLNDRQFLEAVEVAVNARKISTSLIQRKLSIGYGKAAKFIDIMEDMGIVGEANGQRPREVLLTPDEWREKLARASLE